MSVSEAPVKAEYLNEISDSVAAMVTCTLQEQLAPILETIREHSKLLDWHSALLNHSTIMNRYNVGKLDDLRDLQTNVNYKLQFHIDPEDRKRPTYRGARPTPTVIAARTESPQKDNLAPSERSPFGSSSSVSSRDRTSSESPTGGMSSVTSAPDSPARQPTPVFEPPHASNSSLPPTPSQVTADGSGTAMTRRGLRRERAHDETPDPMWNSSRMIDLFEPIPTPTPAPPCIPPLAAVGPSTAGPSERAAGKKRKCEDDASEAPVNRSGSECDELERRKRKKDTTISTERIPIPESFLRVARLNIFGEPSLPGWGHLTSLTFGKFCFGCLACACMDHCLFLHNVIRCGWLTGILSAVWRE
ncbi:hypothetical protein EDB85DRAFT_1943500 [Lactarius pseudohatsudake]|nr:hypothetical protein EDB85DRAFT_1943500 [Lactarius pseudohatsudake]